MGRPGAKPKGKVRLTWSPQFAYAIGLMVSDGNLSPDGRHLVFTSKDRELVEHFITALGLTEQHIGQKARGGEKEKRYFVAQFGDVLFYRFLLDLGLMPNKSRSLRHLKIPDEHFSHFLRGVFDGDGSSFSYRDKRWRSSFMYYMAFCSASPVFLQWLRKKIFTLYGIQGAITRAKNANTEQLVYAKKATRMLSPILYKNAGELYLSRKHLKLFQTFSIVSPPTKNARVS